jgi:tricorn protease
MADSSYLRYPHLAQDLVTFVAEDDVWLAPVTGGRASRLTADQVPAAYPRLSPSARHLAWTSGRDGTREAYAVEVDGGPVIRLTHFGDAMTRTAGWLSDDEVVVVSTTGRHLTGRTWAHAVSLAGATRALPYGPLSTVSVSPDGAVLLGRAYFGEPAYWKRYGGGTGGRIWLDRDGGGEFAHILGEVGNHLVNPMFLGDRIAFLSDHEGVGALYSTTREGSDLRRHTDHGPYYARNATTDGTRVIYQCAGDIWLLDSLDAAPVKLDLALGGARSGREPFPVSARSGLGEFSLDRTGRTVAAEVRGTVHWLPAEDGPARTLLADPGVRGRLPVAVPGAAAVLCVSDAGGEDGLELIPADGAPARRIGPGLLGRVLELALSPDGRTAAVASNDGRLLTVDLDEAGPDGAGITELVRSEINEPHGLAFSPDSAYLAWAQPWATERGHHIDSHIRVARLGDGTIADVTSARFDSHSPAFTHDGKYLAFLSNRTYDPTYDERLFDLGFLPGVRPYLVTLADDTPSPFAPELGGRPTGPEAEEPAGKAKQDDEAEQDAAEADRIRVDLDGIAERIVAFPVEAGRYAQLSAVKDGVVWLNRPTRTVLGETWKGTADQPPTATLVRYDLVKRKRTTVVADLDAYQASGDGGRIAYRRHDELKIKASAAPDEEETIGVDLDRIRVRVDPAAEWPQMYDETWRLMRDNFWRADMGGADWPAIGDRYRPLLGRLGSHDDLVDLLWELQAELSTSHGYVIAPGVGSPEATRQGLLGADLAADADGTWRIARILPAESSVVDGRSPLAAPGVRAGVGDAIVAIDGRPVDPARGPAPLLAGKADRAVELTLRPAEAVDSADAADADPATRTDRRVVVVPLASDKTLRYHDLIAARRAKVHELSGGRLGYLHVPNMQAWGWAEFHRDHVGEITRDGLIFDLRENGGGHTSQLVVEKLTRRVIGWDVSRRSKPASYPNEAPRGPIVSLVDELAGSDGDIAAQAIKIYGIGPVVGVRTWGGVVGYDQERGLVDGTLLTQPKLAFWFDGVGWSVENYGVDPDVEVPIAPQDWAAGRDPQLETGVRLALEALDRQPPATPPTL